MFKLYYFIYLKWLILVFSEKILDLINFVFAPIFVLFANDDGWLPQWLYWFQTPDNSIDGDLPWQLYRRPFKENSGIKKYFNRIAWLWRNSSCGYANDVVGIKKDDDSYILTNFGNSFSSAKPPNYDITGGKLLKWYLHKNGILIGFQYFKIHVWENSNHCFRLNIGWKLWDWDNPKWKSCNIVFSINPWKTLDNGK